LGLKIVPQRFFFLVFYYIRCNVELLQNPALNKLTRYKCEFCFILKKVIIAVGFYLLLQLVFFTLCLVQAVTTCFRVYRCHPQGHAGESTPGTLIM